MKNLRWPKVLWVVACACPPRFTNAHKSREMARREIADYGPYCQSCDTKLKLGRYTREEEG